MTASNKIHPISALHEWCTREKIAVPKFVEQASCGKAHEPIFSYIVEVYGGTYGPSLGSSKSEAKAHAAEKACEALDIYFTGSIVKAPEAAANEKNAVCVLFEYAVKNQMPKPKLIVIGEVGPPHDRTYEVKFKIAERLFPVGSGKNKDSAKRRAAARALSVLHNVKLREFLRGPDPDVAFGQQIAEYSWEAFGVLCEELGETAEFCRASNLACFLIENEIEGSLKVVSMGTGSKVCSEDWRVGNGERIIDGHAPVVARRGLQVFLYEQLQKLLLSEESIFEFSSPTVAELKTHFQFHMYLKEPPCGDALWYTDLRETDREKSVKNNHSEFYNPKDGLGKVRFKRETRDIVSCSDKIYLWNKVGIQGSMLTNFIPPIFINSITVSTFFVPSHLTRAFCCRYNADGIMHPWIQHGTVEGIEESLSPNDLRSCWSIYWSHGSRDLKDEVEDLIRDAGILNAIHGTHLEGTVREGEIPIICKRNIFRKYKRLCEASGARFDSQHSYLDFKLRCKSYKMSKNDFFKTVDDNGQGLYPIMDYNIDSFWLQDIDLRDVDED